MNQVLNFLHRIPIEVFHNNDDVTVTVTVNNEVKFSETFEKNKIHKKEVLFYHEYNDADKNTLEFNFSGKIETKDRYLIINSVEINKVRLYLYNSVYEPKINLLWWNTLSAEQKDYYTDMIHGNRGNKFGWFGKIKFDYCCGVDLKSKFKVSNNKTEILLGSSIDWVFLDEKSNTSIPGKSNNGTLL
jgi:hypothetical protein